MAEKPAGCVTMFMGNLSYDIDDDKANEFFSECGAVTLFHNHLSLNNLNLDIGEENTMVNGSGIRRFQGVWICGIF